MEIDRYSSHPPKIIIDKLTIANEAQGEYDTYLKDIKDIIFIKINETINNLYSLQNESKARSTIFLIKKYGIDVLNELNKQKHVIKIFRQEELLDKIVFYKTKLKEMGIKF